MLFIAKVAKSLYAVPASFSNVERFFCAAGRVVTSRRPNLKGELVADILYGHANIVRGFNGDRVVEANAKARGDDVGDAVSGAGAAASV